MSYGGVTRQPYNAAVLLSSVTHWFTRKDLSEDLSDGLQNSQCASMGVRGWGCKEDGEGWC